LAGERLILERKRVAFDGKKKKKGNPSLNQTTGGVAPRKKREGNHVALKKKVTRSTNKKAETFFRLGKKTTE